MVKSVFQVLIKKNKTAQHNISAIDTLPICPHTQGTSYECKFFICMHEDCFIFCKSVGLFTLNPKLSRSVSLSVVVKVQLKTAAPHSFSRWQHVAELLHMLATLTACT